MALSHSDDNDVPKSSLERHDAKVRRRQTVRLIILGAIAALAVALAIDNSQSVNVGYLFGSTSAPLVIALVLAFALGVIVGFLGSLHRRND